LVRKKKSGEKGGKKRDVAHSNSVFARFITLSFNHAGERKRIGKRGKKGGGGGGKKGGNREKKTTMIVG